MAMTRAEFTNYFIRGLKDVFWTNYKEAKSVYEELFNIESSGKNYEEVLQMVGFGYAAQEGELAPVTLQDGIEGYKTRFTHLKYGLGYQISQELIDDDMYGRIKQFPSQLARSARATIEKLCADVLNLGFSGGTALADGQQLFSASHVKKRGGTQSNMPTAAVDLSWSTLKQGAVDLRKQLDDSSMPMGFSDALNLVVPADLEFDASEILKSVDRPDTANRAINALSQRRRWNLVVWDYLSDTDAWFILSPKANHQLYVFNRKGIAQEAENDKLIDAWKHFVRYRISVGAADYRGIYGSAGV